MNAGGKGNAAQGPPSVSGFFSNMGEQIAANFSFGSNASGSKPSNGTAGARPKASPRTQQKTAPVPRQDGPEEDIDKVNYNFVEKKGVSDDVGKQAEPAPKPTLQPMEPGKKITFSRTKKGQEPKKAVAKLKLTH